MRLSIVKTSDGHWAVVDSRGNELWQTTFWIAAVGFLNGYDAKTGGDTC